MLTPNILIWVNLKVVTNSRFRSEFTINGDGKFLTLLDKKATQDAKVNCSSFNYARCNDKVHTVLDVDPAGEKYNYDPKFREESRFVIDKNGNIKKDIEENKILYEAPSLKNMSKYDRAVRCRQDNFRSGVFAWIK